MARKDDGDLALGLLGLLIVVIGIIVWITPYILRALAFILGALFSLCVRYKKEIGRITMELLVIGMAFFMAFVTCSGHLGGQYYDLYLIISSVAHWLLFRSIALQIMKDGKSTNTETVRKISIINLVEKKDKDIKEFTKMLKQMESTSQINIETCTKKDLLTLAGFNDAKADKFIEERNNGKMWYDIDDFCQDFNPKPHELLSIESRLQFPPRPNLKKGRTVDV